MLQPQLSPLAALLVCAAAAFVVTDIASALVPVRYYSGRWAVTRWLVTGLGWHEHKEMKQPWFNRFADLVQPWRVLRRGQTWIKWKTQKDFPCEETLIRLACGDAHALYRMAPDLIAAQVNAAANVALDCPKANLPLLFVMAGQQVDQSVASEIDAVQQKQEGPPAPPFQISIDSLSLEKALLEYGRIPGFRETLETRPDLRPQILELRSRIETAIQQRIDAFQTSARGAAQLRDQVLYVAAASLVMSLLNGWTLLGSPAGWLPRALVAAFLAPYFGDLRTFLRQAR